MSEPAPNPIPLILWSAFGMTHLVLVFITTLIPPQPSNPGMVLFVIPALASATISVGARSIFKGNFPAQTLFIVRWALAESATLMGFVSWYISGDRPVQAVCTLAGLAAWAIAMPRDVSAWGRPS